MGEASNLGENVWSRRVSVARSRLYMIQGNLSRANDLLSDLNEDVEAYVRGYSLITLIVYSHTHSEHTGTPRRSMPRICKD